MVVGGVAVAGARSVGETYRGAGVDIAAGEAAVARIRDKVRSTYRPEVLGDIGGFGGLVTLPAGYREPVLVSSTDGVGTDTIGDFTDDADAVDLVGLTASNGFGSATVVLSNGATIVAGNGYLWEADDFS